MDDATRSTIRHGVLAGTAATILMTVPIMAGQRLGLFRTAPPVAISGAIARTTPVLPDPGTTAFPLVWPIAHLGYGAVGGALYAALRPRLPRAPWQAGLLAGTAVWTGSYAGYLPAVGLYPPPDADSRTRVATMLLAHAIYGVTLALLIDRDASP